MNRLRTYRERLVTAGLLATFLILGGVACGNDSDSASNDSVDHSVETADGRSYDCFTYTEVNRGGLACEDVTSSAPEANHNSSITASTETQGGRTYHCLTYTKVDRGGIDCFLVDGLGISSTTSELDSNGSISASTETTDGRSYDCFTYTKVDRGGIDCLSVAAS